MERTEEGQRERGVRRREERRAGDARKCRRRGRCDNGRDSEQRSEGVQISVRELDASAIEIVLAASSTCWRLRTFSYGDTGDSETVNASVLSRTMHKLYPLYHVYVTTTRHRTTSLSAPFLATSSLQIVGTRTAVLARPGDQRTAFLNVCQELLWRTACNLIS